MVVGYWAAELTIYANKIRIVSLDKLLMRRLIVGILLGWAMILITFIKVYIANKQ